MKMICFPHAGGFSNYYLPLKKYNFHLVNDVYLYEYPGRGEKGSLKSAETMEELIELIMYDVYEYVKDEPCIIFGHSMGAYVAYEVTRSMKKQVKLLIVSGQQAPECFQGVSLNCDSLDAVTDYVLSMGGMSSELFAKPMTKDFFIPIVQQDLKLVRDYTPILLEEDEKPKSIAVLVGENDTEVVTTDLKQWYSCGKSNMGVKYFKGGHFYMNGNETALAEYIDEIIGDLEK